MLLFAMAYATLRERYTQHDKTGIFILWLTLTLQFLLSSSLNFVKKSTIFKKLLLHTIPTP
jgi:hypothetical protein